MTPLAAALAEARLTQVKLAALARTTKQQINKLIHDERKMTPDWAQRLAPHLGIAWPALMDWDHQEMAELLRQPISREGLIWRDLNRDELQEATGTAHFQPSHAPKQGQFIEDDAELSLIAFWRGLNQEEKRFMLSLLRNGALGK